MSRTLARTSPGGLLASALAELDIALRASRKSIEIATPFMSLPVAEQLVRAADEGRAEERRLVTAVNDAAVLGGYLDPSAIEAFITAGFEVKSLRNLHAKVVVVDRAWGIVGSGNLTSAGVSGQNAELGVVLSRAQARAASNDHLAGWWRAAEPVDMGALQALASRRPTNPQRRERQGQGGLWKPSTDYEPLLPARRGSGGYWLKIMYDVPGRTSASHWRGGRWVSDRHTFASDGRALGRPTYEIGDHLVVYVSGTNLSACPAILRVAAKPVLDPERVRREAQPGDEERWAWVTEVETVRAIDLAAAPTLSDIGVSSSSVRQHGHIRLAPKQYRRAYEAMKG